MPSSSIRSPSLDIECFWAYTPWTLWMSFLFLCKNLSFPRWLSCFWCLYLCEYVWEFWWHDGCATRTTWAKRGGIDQSVHRTLQKAVSINSQMQSAVGRSPGVPRGRRNTWPRVARLSCSLSPPRAICWTRVDTWTFLATALPPLALLFASRLVSLTQADCRGAKRHFLPDRKNNSYDYISNESSKIFITYIQQNLLWHKLLYSDYNLKSGDCPKQVKRTHYIIYIFFIANHWLRKSV